MEDDLYLILLKNEQEKEIEIGSLGEIRFEDGYYIYVGSARNNISSRLKRHLQKEDKNKYWHIDYLRSELNFRGFLSFSRKEYDSECRLVSYIEKETGFKKVVKGFGSSDTECYSHLLFNEEVDSMKFLN